MENHRVDLVIATERRQRMEVIQSPSTTAIAITGWGDRLWARLISGSIGETAISDIADAQTIKD